MSIMKIEALRTSLISLLLLLVCPLVIMEEFFHSRDRSDNLEYRDIKDQNVVTSTEKAEEVLKRYGYLRCGGFARRRISHRGRRCSEDDIRKAIRLYQNNYNMPVTGRLDVDTLKLMSESRCGNPDDESGAAFFKPMISPRRRRHWRKNQNYQTLSRHRRSVADPADISTEHIKSSQRYPVIQTERQAVPLHDYVSQDRRPYMEEPIPRGTAISRRRRWLEKYVRDLESGELEKELDRNQHVVDVARRKRGKRSIADGVEGHAFSAEVVTWRLIGSAYSNQLTVNTQRSALALAFRMWGEVIPLIFHEDTKSPVSDIDILIAFGRGEHLNCPNHFDGFGGQLSHAIKMSANAEIHVDDDEQLTIGSDHGTNLVKVAVHEVGHALGLFHTSRNYSIMYAIYSQVIPNNNFELGWEDRKLVQDIYGICKVHFNTVFDWVRRRPDGQLIYNTYFFKHNHYWMYENRYNRTRYGDPLFILPEWKGIPEKVDAYAHVWTYSEDSAYFFKGNRYWLYDSNEDKVVTGYPRNISSDFRSIPDSTFPNIPGHIDSVFFDKRDGNLYFFKGHMVYAYDVSRGQEGCCLPGFPKAITKDYPNVTKESVLPPHLDAVYYSYTDRSMYFFKGIYYWQNVAFNPLDRRRTNKIKGPWLVSKKWFDICEV